MTRVTTAITAVFGLAVLVYGCERQVSFEADVLPILEAQCVSCHGGAGEGVDTSGLDLRNYEGVMRGTALGKVVVPNSSESSALYLVTAHKTDPKIHMPPHVDDALAEGRGFSLSERQVRVIKTWIDQGALRN